MAEWELGSFYMYVELLPHGGDRALAAASRHFIREHNDHERFLLRDLEGGMGGRFGIVAVTGGRPGHRARALRSLLFFHRTSVERRDVLLSGRRRQHVAG